jgi:hypothetical protein
MVGVVYGVMTSALPANSVSIAKFLFVWKEFSSPGRT